MAVHADQVGATVRNQIARLLVRCRSQREVVTGTGALFPVDLDYCYAIRVFATLSIHACGAGDPLDVLPSVVGVEARHAGPPDTLPAVYAACLARAEVEGLAPHGPIREMYASTDAGVVVRLVVPVAEHETR